MLVYLAPFLGGLAGSAHCLGMCGGFPLAIASVARRRPLQRQLLYNLGRVNALVFLGVLSGAVGAGMQLGGPPRLMQQILALAAGSIMLLIGAEQLGLLRAITPTLAATIHRSLAGWLGNILRSPSPGAPLAVGVLNAFLPCQLIYAFAAQAAATASPLHGGLVMLAFGLGTVPAMLSLGATPTLLSPRLRLHLSRLAAIGVILFGAITILRAFDIGLLHSHQHHH